VPRWRHKCLPGRNARYTTLIVDDGREYEHNDGEIKRYTKRVNAKRLHAFVRSADSVGLESAV